MLRGLWNRVVRRRDAAAVEREVDLRQMDPAERRLAGESIEDRQADQAVEERFGSLNPEQRPDDDGRQSG